MNIELIPDSTLGRAEPIFEAIAAPLRDPYKMVP